ncbi:5034_t:CDS:2, partial [Entrophospora sp. SA101]
MKLVEQSEEDKQTLKNLNERLVEEKQNSLKIYLDKPLPKLPNKFKTFKRKVKTKFQHLVEKVKSEKQELEQKLTRALSKQSNPEGLPCTNNSLSFFLKIPAKTQIEILVHAAGKKFFIYGLNEL